MRPVVEVVETDEGYIVRRGRRRAGPVVEFADAVALAHRMVPGVVLILGPGEVPDSDVVAVGYRAEDILAVQGRR